MMTTTPARPARPRARAVLAATVLAGLQGLGAATGEAASKAEIQDLVAREAQRNATVPASLALAVARVESNFNPKAHSDAGARGVMQIMPDTARGVFGVDPERLWQPRTNVRLGIRYMERLYRRYDGKWELALSHYNGGTLRGQGGDAVPHDYTRDYVQAVMHFNNRFARESTRVKLASAAGNTGRADDAGTRLTEHPSEYMVFNDTGSGDAWRRYLDAADYWLASPEQKAEIRRERRAQKAERRQQAQRFNGSGDAHRHRDTSGRTGETGQGDAHATGSRRDGHGNGDDEPVGEDTTRNRFTRVSPEVKRLRDNFQRYLGDG